VADRPVLALYRRYRPDTFADVIGQDHVISPLTAAITKGRVNHAYLFSGPRGCGKTTSARVLARSLNCAEGPTPTPCGRCDSCHDLARGGPGSLDVIEIDAASHRGIDDARDLRDRVTFAPVRDPYKVVIIDEAHQITNEGFNALLKVVEEPPEHVVFVFATTEPEKVLGTIRSRTHHFPFRLVPPRRLLPYLEQLCDEEGVAVAPGALGLVLRAGGGSVRDTLSVLDQLIAGAGPTGVDLEVAADLLGYVPEGLLDDIVDALSAVDGAAAFGVVHRAVEGGHDPRRFAHDLLERLRALVIVSRVGDSAADVLPDQSSDAIERLRVQAGRFGVAELRRAADTVATALADMAGATSPRLLLELLVARLLVVGSETGAVVAARLDRLERQAALVAGGTVVTQPQGVAQAGTVTEVPTPTLAPLAAASVPVPTPVASAQPSASSSPAPASGQGSISVHVLRRSWETVTDALREIKRVTWSLVSESAQVIALDERTLTLGFVTSGLADTFNNRGHGVVVREALVSSLGIDRTVLAVVGPRSEAAAAAAAASPLSSKPMASARVPTRAQDRDEPPPDWDDVPPPQVPTSTARPVAPPASASPQVSAPASAPASRIEPVHVMSDGSEDPRHDSVDAPSEGAHGAALLERLLGGRVISEE